MRLAVAEDSAVLRDGLVRTLTAQGHEVVLEAGDAEELLAGLGSSGAELVVLDVRMPPTHTDEGLRAAVQVRARHRGVAIMVFSQYVERRYARRLLAEAPASMGYLLKDRVMSVEEFLDALERVAGGGTVLDPEVVAQIIGGSTRSDRLAELSGREREVLELLAQGLSNTALADRLVISLGAVEKHVRSIFAKLRLPLTDDTHRRVLAVLAWLEV